MRHMAIEVIYYTDPFCPWSWAFEPSFRRLLTEFDGNLRVTYVMAGMRSELADPTRAAVQALEASQASGMPVDARLWLSDPPRTSHPAALAVKAAAEQGDPARYLRRLREAIMCRRRPLQVAGELIAEAREVSGLRLERFKLDLGSNAILEKLAEDLTRAQSVAAKHHSPGAARVTLPSLEFAASGGAVHGVYGYVDYPTVRDTARAAGAEPDEKAPPSVIDALHRFGPMSAAEVAAVCELPGPRAAAELWRMALEWQVRPERLGTAELWMTA